MIGNSRENGRVLATALLLLCISLPEVRAQVGPLPAWKVLAEESRVVAIVDVVEAQLNVIDPDGKAKAEREPDGKFTLGNPVLFTRGILARVRIGEVIKSDGKTKPGDTVDVFVHGYYGTDLPHVPMSKEKLVLFLRPLDPNNREFAHAVIEQIEKIDSSVKFMG